MLFNLTMMSYLWLLISSIFIIVGAYISYRLCSSTKKLIKLIVVLPMLVALFQIHVILTTGTIYDNLFLICEISYLGLYLLLAVMLSGKRILKNIEQQRMKHA